MKRPDLLPEEKRKNLPPEVCRRYAGILKQMVDCKTVFTRDGANQAAFDRFYGVLENCFPTLTARAERLQFGSGCFIYVIRGRDAEKNVMLMSHHDVVDGGEGWDTDPFCAVEKDGAAALSVGGQGGFQMPQKGGLAAAAFAAQHHILPLLNGQLHIFQGVFPGSGVGKGQILDIEMRHWTASFICSAVGISRNRQ